MRWWMSLLSTVLTPVAVAVAPPAAAVDAPIGRLGDTLRVQTNGMIADVTVGSVLPSDIPGRMFWDCYRELVSNVVLINPRTGEHLAQWNL